MYYIFVVHAIFTAQRLPETHFTIRLDEKGGFNESSNIHKAKCKINTHILAETKSRKPKTIQQDRQGNPRTGCLDAVWTMELSKKNFLDYNRTVTAVDGPPIQ